MSFIKAFLTALIGSVAVNLLILVLFRPIVINPAMPLHALSVGPVAMLTTIGIIGAMIVYAIMRALLAHPARVFVWTAVVVLIVSFIPDYLIIGETSGMFAGGTLGSALVLASMHIVAAIITVWSLVKLWPGRHDVVSTR